MPLARSRFIRFTAALLWEAVRAMPLPPGKTPPARIQIEGVSPGAFTPAECGYWEYRVSAWVDRWASWRHELERKVAAGQEDLSGELSEGAVLLGRESL